MQIYFVRHGETNYNVKNICNSDPKKNVYLTELGKKQIEEVRKRLIKEKIEVIFISQFSRTKESAEIINRDLNVPIKVDKRINDRKSGFEGRSYFDFIKFVEKDRFNVKPKGGESFQEEKKRVFSFLDDLIKMNYDIVLVISHEEIIKIAAGYFKKLSNEEIWNIRVENGQIMEFEI